MKGKEVHHLCGNNKCCNPCHLQLVTSRLHRGLHSQLPHEKIDRQRLFREILKDWRDCEDFNILLSKYELPQKLTENIILKKTKVDDFWWYAILILSTSTATHYSILSEGKCSFNPYFFGFWFLLLWSIFPLDSESIWDLLRFNQCSPPSGLTRKDFTTGEQLGRNK